MSTGFQIDEQYATYFVTPAVVDWVDLFSRKVYRDIAIDSLRYCVDEKGLIIYGYVIMRNHIHMIVRSAIGQLSATIRNRRSKIEHNGDKRVSAISINFR
jgi:REP element-mobilizing transposase RayT